MRRLLLDGSPRGTGSNSALIASWLAEGLVASPEGRPELLHLFRQRELAAQTEAFLAAEEVAIVFPLYTDSVPGILKAFIDGLAEADPAKLRGKRLAWVVHCGFPESAHIVPVAAWLHRLSTRLGFVDFGVAMRSGSTPLNLIPTSGKSKAAGLYRRLGEDLGRGHPFDPATLAALARPGRIHPVLLPLFRLLRPTGLLDLYWIVMLRKNGGWKRRFDRPWATEAGAISP